MSVADRPTGKGIRVARNLMLGTFLVAGVLAAGLVLFKVYSTEERAGTTDPVEADADPGISQRLQVIEDETDAALPVEPYQTATVGTLIESEDGLIVVEADSETHSWPVTDDTTFVRSGEAVSTEAIEPGQTVRVVTERRGDRQNGWITAAVRVELAAPAAEAVDETPESRTRTAPTVPPAEDHELTFHGQVSEVGAASIRVVDESDEVRTFPVAPAARVYRDGSEGGLPLLVVGDRVTLIGSRADRDTDASEIVIDRIGVDSIDDAVPADG